MSGVTWADGGSATGYGQTCEPFNTIQLCEQLIDDPVSDTSAVVASLRCDGIEFIKKQDTRGRCRRTPAHNQFFSQAGCRASVRKCMDSQPCSISEA